MHVPQSALLVSVVMLASGCAKKRQNAVVTGKEHIPAHVEGTEYKEHQLDKEQWLVRIKMADGRQATASLDEAEWKTFQVGDRVRADYSQGNYTGTVWFVEIHKP